MRIALLKERVNCGTADDKQSLVAQSLGTDLGPPVLDEILLDGRITHQSHWQWVVSFRWGYRVDSKSPFGSTSVVVKSTGRFGRCIGVGIGCPEAVKAEAT